MKGPLHDREAPNYTLDKQLFRTPFAFFLRLFIFSFLFQVLFGILLFIFLLTLFL